MLWLRRRPVRTKKIVSAFLLAAAAVVAYSWVYNHPIRFRPKWSTGPDSQRPGHPSSRHPDNIVLTVAPDMSTMATVTWRTSGETADSAVQYGPAAGERESAAVLEAESVSLFNDELKTDKTVWCHSARLTGLTPGTAYQYRVGSPREDVWSDWRTFSTAPAPSESFSFVYFGDTQVGVDAFGEMLEEVNARHPGAAFHMIGGDLVDMGDLRNLWDDFMYAAGLVFSTKPLAPVMGNHDFGKKGIGPRTFEAYFNVDGPGGTPDVVENYSFQTGGVHFMAVNNGDPAGQVAWLERELRAAEESGCDFKVVVCHYPVYNVDPDRDERGRAELWVPLFDEYRVDLVLGAHDHSYMRSKPLRGGRPADDGAGTVYVVANASTKQRDFKRLDIAERQFSDEMTYQVVDVTRDPDGTAVLKYAAYDEDGDVKDEMQIRKTRETSVNKP